jgi:DNA polymerase alpha subunit A
MRKETKSQMVALEQKMRNLNGSESFQVSELKA